jgi:opacity protein-like surface antigen
MRVLCATALAAMCTARAAAEDSEMPRAYLQLRSAAFNENFGVQDGWGLAVGANLNYYVGLELSFDAFEEVLEYPQLGQIFEQSILNLTPQIRLRYPLGNGRWVPYVFAGPGVTFLQLNDRKDPAFHRNVEGDDTLLSGVFGAGLEYYIADNVSFSIEGKYALVQSREVTVDGNRRDVDVSTPIVMFGVRAYFNEIHKHPLIEPKKEAPTRFHGGFRYGASLLADRRLNSDLSLEPVAAALGGEGNQAGSVLFGVDIGSHWGFELAADYAEYNLASDTFGVVGEYATYSILPQVRYHWLFMDGRLSPFVSAGAGITYAEFNDRKPPGEFVKIDSKGIHPAADIGTGLEYFIARNLSFSTEAHYLASWDHDIPLNDVKSGSGSFGAVNLFLGMRFYFGERSE